MRLIRLFTVIILLTVFFTSVTKSSFAETTTPSATLEASQSSYVMFYPIVAGTTADQSSYFLKLLRDRISELLTFGDEKKSALELRLATKRLLEGEQLIKSGHIQLLASTLSKFDTKLAAAYDYAIKARTSDSFPDLVDQINQQTEKYQILLNQILDGISTDQRSLIEDTLKRTREIQDRIRQEMQSE